MTPVDLEALARRAVDRYGAAHQIDKAVEELAELIAALMQHRAGRHGMDPVREEIADVTIMLLQLRDIFGPADVEGWICLKMDRLAARLDGGNP
ncbi:MAG: hypothetical protein FJ027_24855 [Candidatus Rokubacteria bacterium]|nr:hypothetical protein [Candidatus Rokubacteria bacterium]